MEKDWTLWLLPLTQQLQHEELGRLAGRRVQRCECESKACVIVRIADQNAASGAECTDGAKSRIDERRPNASALVRGEDTDGTQREPTGHTVGSRRRRERNLADDRTIRLRNQRNRQ